MIVVGLGFGDEGKGLVTSWLCSKVKNPIVVRFNGGHQAGHTVVYNGKRHVFSNFGSGTLQGVPTYWSKYCTFEPLGVMREYEKLESPTLFVNPLCPITTPYDIHRNIKLEEMYEHGSVGVGFGATIERQEAGYKLFYRDLFFKDIFLEKVKNIANYYGNPDIDLSHWLDACFRVYELTLPSYDSIIHAEGQTPIFEGAQGIMLDQDYGLFPHVTRSSTTTKNALEMYGATEVFYVTRSYQTRHGNGWMSNENPEKITLVNNERETNVFNMHQGDFRTSELDPFLLSYAILCDRDYSRHLRKNLVITCMDQHKINIGDLLNKLSTKFDNVYFSTGDSLEHIKQFN